MQKRPKVAAAEGKCKEGRTRRGHRGGGSPALRVCSKGEPDFFDGPGG